MSAPIVEVDSGGIVITETDGKSIYNPSEARELARALDHAADDCERLRRGEVSRESIRNMRDAIAAANVYGHIGIDECAQLLSILEKL